MTGIGTAPTALTASLNLSGVNVVTNVSGQTVVGEVSGQTVTFSNTSISVSGNMISISGQPVSISGNALGISGQIVISQISGSIVDVSGTVVSTLYPHVTLKSRLLTPITAASGGVTLAGETNVQETTIRNQSGNGVMLIGSANNPPNWLGPTSGIGYELYAGQTFTFPGSVGTIKIVASVSGQYISTVMFGR